TEGRIGGVRRPAFPWPAVRTLIYSVVNLSVKPAPRRGAYGAGHIGGRGASERTGPSPGASGVLPGPSPPASGLRRAPAVGALSAPPRSATLRRGQPFSPEPVTPSTRSEEHTSELQSRFDLV